MVRSEMSARSNSAKAAKIPKTSGPRRHGGVDRRPLPGEDLQTDAPFGEVINGIDKVTQIAAEPVQFPHQEGVARAEPLQTCRQFGAVILLPRRVVFVLRARVDTGRNESISLQVRALISPGWPVERIAAKNLGLE